MGKAWSVWARFIKPQIEKALFSNTGISMRMETTGFGVILLGLEGSRPCRIPKDTTRLASRY